MKRARACDIALVACGNMSTQSLILYHDVIQEQAAELRALGAVGDLLGTFIGSDGQIIDHPLNDCVMALHPDDLKAIPTSILVAGGMAKLEIIRAVLRGGYVNMLVTDENVAEALLA
jgi:DNA-binding transcriptional regulator LsrR (DeoR family)